MAESNVLTLAQLRVLETKKKNGIQKIADKVICGLSPAAAVGVILQYLLVPNYRQYEATNVYVYFIGFFAVLLAGWFIWALFSEKALAKLRYKAPFYVAVFLLLGLYDYATLKTGLLMLPYFPWPDRILNAIIDDRLLLLSCIKNSLILLFSGYFIGAVSGLITGIAAGWSERVRYWIGPVTRVLGPIPSTTWLPIILIVASSLFGGSVFLIALGVWYPVTMSSQNGVLNVKKSNFEVASTLGASKWRQVFRVAIPAAMPNIFQGLTQGMSVACTALIVAEMMGVESGLGWYINWQKGWAEFAKMYAAIIVICLTFTVVNIVLTFIKKRVLRWKEGAV